MNVKNLLCLVSALSLATVSVAQAQTLTELAKQEKQRRAKLRTSGAATKVYTESDRSSQPIEAAPASAAATTGTDPLAAAAPGAPKEKTREELDAERQKDWADRLKKAQDEIAGLEAVITKNERNLASLINITPARQDLANSIEADKKRLADLKQSLVTLEDERRRAGMPRR